MDYEKKLSEAQNTLSTIMTAINRENVLLEEKRKENKDLESEVVKAEEKTAAAKDLRDRYDADAVIAGDKSLEIQNKVRKEEGALVDLIAHHEQADKDLIAQTEKTREDIARINDEKILATKIAEEKKDSLRNDVRVLEDALVGLSAEIDGKKTLLAEMSAQEIKQSETIKTNTETNTILLAEKDSIGKDIRDLKNDVIDQETFVEKNKITIRTLESEIADKQAEKNTLQADIATLETGRTEFVQAKMVLQKDRESLTNRELFIMGKYEQAGVPYGDQSTSGLEGYVSKSASLEQRNTDLDKREKFIKDQYAKAGIDYL